MGLSYPLLYCLQHGHRDIQHDYELRNVLGQGALPCLPVAVCVLVQQGGTTALCSWRRLGRGRAIALHRPTPAGAFGVVRMAVHRRTGLKYAVKTVWKSQLRRRADVEDLRREVQVGQS